MRTPAWQAYPQTEPDQLMGSRQQPRETCLEFDEVTDGASCSGAVELRESLTGTGTPIARCDTHWAKRLEREEQLRVDYPDSPNPPSWFDPSYAGEHWDEDY